MNYWEWAIEPCRVSDEFYYVGTTKGPAHLLVTDDGLVLIDTSYPQSLYMITENMRKLGFDPADIRHIIHTHGHIDHTGGTRALVALSGAKTYVGEGDADMVRGLSGRDYCREMGRPYEEPFEPDVLLRDGDVYTFGKTAIRFVSTPGHTEGTVSLFFELHDKGKPYRAGLFGGAGLNTLYRAYLEEYHLPFSYRTDFLASIDKVLDEAVEIHIGNHLGDNHHKKKMALLGGDTNPFIDPTSWRTFLQKRRAEAVALFEQEPME